MSFVRISLPKKLSQETKDNVSIAIHRSLIREFNIPEDDYFHVIEEMNSQEIKFPKSYLGIAHTAHIIFIQIIAGKGRTKEQKKKLYREIALRIANTTSISPTNIIITLLENNGLEDWSFGNGEMQIPKHLPS